MENRIEVPLHEYEELVRDSERLRIVTEKAVRTRKYRPTMEIDFILLVTGYQDISGRPEKCYNPNTHLGSKPITPAQIKPEVSIDSAKIAKRISEAMNGIHFQVNGGMTNE